MTLFDTRWPADSVEFCPHPNAPSLFACGTYKLEESALLESDDTGHAITIDARQPVQRRHGECLIFETTTDLGDVLELQRVQVISLPAVPDMKWCHTSCAVDPILAVADSEGSVTLYQWETQTRMRDICAIRCASTDILCLSVDWSNRRAPSSALGSLVVSLSNGSLSLLQPNDGHGFSVTASWHAHDFEPWVAAWDCWDTNVIYSGGDDLKMKGWDIRQGSSRPTFVNNRFGAGVTGIQSHPHLEHVFAVGSYDSTVKIFDARNPLSPLMHTDVGGGAWRVKWHPSPFRKEDLLVACMHDGFKVVRFDFERGQSDNSPRILKHYDKHQSLAYGADWSHAQGNADDANTMIASCSFYDHALHLWRG